jgi:hypothetical protein
VCRTDVRCTSRTRRFGTRLVRQCHGTDEGSVHAVTQIRESPIYRQRTLETSADHATTGDLLATAGPRSAVGGHPSSPVRRPPAAAKWPSAGRSRWPPVGRLPCPPTLAAGRSCNWRRDDRATRAMT